MKALLEAGVHFGNRTRRWNPKMKPYIFGKRNGIHIVDLQKTLQYFEDAGEFVRDLAANGRNILFVGTKRQAQEPIAEEADRAGQPYVNQRWLGGMLTNFQTIRKSLTRFQELERMQTDASWEMISKKERARYEKELGKLDKVFHGIKKAGSPARRALRGGHDQGERRLALRRGSLEVRLEREEVRGVRGEVGNGPPPEGFDVRPLASMEGPPLREALLEARR